MGSRHHQKHDTCEMNGHKHVRFIMNTSMVAERCHYIFSDLFKKYYIKPIIFKAIVKTKYDLN